MRGGGWERRQEEIGAVEWVCKLIYPLTMIAQSNKQQKKTKTNRKGLSKKVSMLKMILKIEQTTPKHPHSHPQEMQKLLENLKKWRKSKLLACALMGIKGEEKKNSTNSNCKQIFQGILIIAWLTFTTATIIQPPKPPPPPSKLTFII